MRQCTNCSGTATREWIEDRAMIQESCGSCVVDGPEGNILDDLEGDDNSDIEGSEHHV
ncbi:hypothetical protein C8R44DRAFT_818041 [Mycena epipterygia]|nr:hypothetical protein C8R44DRAFT_818041 [Mycena epipterygia]